MNRRTFSRSHSSYLEDNYDESPPQEIATALHTENTILGHGRTQHGLNGKNADLDPGGQIIVRRITILDTVRSKTMFIEVDLHCYASICPPEDENKHDIAQEIVMTQSEYSGEWSDDYWVFWHDLKMKVPLTVDESDLGTDPNNLKTLAERVVLAIKKDESVKGFSGWASSLLKSLDTSEFRSRGATWLRAP